MLTQARFLLTELAQKRLDLKQKRIVSSAFTELFASTEQSPFRRVQDLAMEKTRDQQQLSQGLGQGQSRRSAMGNRQKLLANFDKAFKNWLTRNLFASRSMILFHDDYMKCEKKHSFTLKSTGVCNAATGADKIRGTSNIVVVMAVGGVKLIPYSDIVYTHPTIPIFNPAFISTTDVVQFVSQVFYKGYGDSCKSVLARFLDGDFTNGERPDMTQIYNEYEFFERQVQHFYRYISDTRNSALTGCNHVQRSAFKSFMEILQSLLGFIANPLIFEACEQGRYFLLGGDWPAWNMSLVLIQQGDGTGPRTSEHLGELIEASVTPQLQEKFEYVLSGHTEETVLEPSAKRLKIQLPFKRLAKALQQIVPVPGPFHIKLNDDDDVVIFNGPIFNSFHEFIQDSKKRRGKKLADVKNLKARMRICLLDAFVGGYMLVRDVILPVLESMSYADNVGLGILRYLCEWAAPEGMLFYDMVYKNGKYPEGTHEILALLLADRVKTQRHHYDKLIIEKLSTERYWVRVEHPMSAFWRIHSNKVDEIVMEGTIIKLVDRETKNVWDPDQIVDKANLFWAKKYSEVVEALKAAFQVNEQRCRNPLGVNSDKLALLGAEFIMNLVAACIRDNTPLKRFVSRGKKVVTDLVEVPALYGNKKVKGCQVLPPAFALFPDLRATFADNNRQASDSADGFRNANGCQYRTCEATLGSEPSHILMLCNHVICSSCTKTNGLCRKCIAETVRQVEVKGTSKQKARETRFVRPQDLHLTREPDADTAEEPDNDNLSIDEDQAEESEHDSESDDEDDDDEDSEDMNTVELSEKERMVMNLKERFTKSLRCLPTSTPLVVDDVVPPIPPIPEPQIQVRFHKVSPSQNNLHV